MKKLRILMSLLLCLLLTFSAVPASGDDGSEEKDLLILYTSDVHCAVDRGWGYVGLYSMKQKLSKEYNLLLVDDGDAIRRSPTTSPKRLTVSSARTTKIPMGRGASFLSMTGHNESKGTVLFDLSVHWFRKVKENRPF